MIVKARMDSEVKLEKGEVIDMVLFDNMRLEDKKMI